MYAGQLVELTTAQAFFTKPLHPYAVSLSNSVPGLTPQNKPEYIPGQPPSLLNPPGGCRFAARCQHCFARCQQTPPLITVSKQHQVRCWLYQ